jgi:hypothetical protein
MLVKHDSFGSYDLEVSEKRKLPVCPPLPRVQSIDGEQAFVGLREKSQDRRRS